MAVPDWAVLAVLGASGLRQLLPALGLPGAGAVWAALVVRAGQAVPVGGLAGIAGRWPLLAVAGW